MTVGFERSTHFVAHPLDFGPVGLGEDDERRSREQRGVVLAELLAERAKVTEWVPRRVEVLCDEVEK